MKRGLDYLWLMPHSFFICALYPSIHSKGRIRTEARVCFDGSFTALEAIGGILSERRPVTYGGLPVINSDNCCVAPVEEEGSGITQVAENESSNLYASPTRPAIGPPVCEGGSLLFCTLRNRIRQGRQTE